jgi:hypothetical protein
MHEASPLISVSIAGVNNTMADMRRPARSVELQQLPARSIFPMPISYSPWFATSFPLQDNSWRI